PRERDLYPQNGVPQYNVTQATVSLPGVKPVLRFEADAHMHMMPKGGAAGAPLLKITVGNNLVMTSWRMGAPAEAGAEDAAWTQDDYIARDRAVKATRFARASLALGPFNNHWDKALLETQTQKTWYQNNTGKKGYSQIDGLVAASDDSEELGGPFRGRSPWT